VIDPVSWLQIGQGWSVITSDGVIVGTVAQVEGDKQSDIFDGLAVASKQPRQIRYVPGEQVAAIYPGKVTLKIGSADIGALEPFQAPPPETKWLPGKTPLATRMSNWLRETREARSVESEGSLAGSGRAFRLTDTLYAPAA
jgi:hypothetical protein